MAIHIGTSGWSYDHWRGIVYPAGASSLERLDRYAERFGTVEVNNTFYRWPKDEVFATWRERVPANFVFSIKASRGLTQFRKLNDPDAWLARMHGGLRRLGKKLGVLLFQLPPHFPCNLERLAGFLSRASGSRTRMAFEFRHPSWDRAEVYELLEAHRAAYCIMSAPDLPLILRVTAPFVFVRLHGPGGDRRYAGCYSDEELREWADRIRGWDRQRRDVFAYFNNDGSGHAVRNAETLKQVLDA